jgi:hypothetical protein
MKNTIEIKIECKGTEIGTLGWFNSIIKGSELVIKNDKNGAPGMFLKTSTSEGKHTYKWLCGKWCHNEDATLYNMNHNETLFVYSEYNDYGVSFSDYSLTPACKLKVEELIDLAVQKFDEWWVNDK